MNLLLTLAAVSYVAICAVIAYVFHLTPNHTDAL
jgi:hypothetical protein